MSSSQTRLAPEANADEISSLLSSLLIPATPSDLSPPSPSSPLSAAPHSPEPSTHPALSTRPDPLRASLPDPPDPLEDALDHVRHKIAMRSSYPGRRPLDDELMLEEIERLRAQRWAAAHALSGLVDAFGPYCPSLYQRGTSTLRRAKSVLGGDGLMQAHG